MPVSGGAVAVVAFGRPSRPCGLARCGPWLLSPFDGTRVDARKAVLAAVIVRLENCPGSSACPWRISRIQPEITADCGVGSAETGLFLGNAGHAAASRLLQLGTAACQRLRMEQQGKDRQHGSGSGRAASSIAQTVDRGAAAGARALSGGDADRQPLRHHHPRAGNACRRRHRRLRGYPRHPRAARPLRHQAATDALSRAQCRRGRAAPDRGARPKARASRWSPTPARRWSPIPATAWSNGPLPPASGWCRSPAHPPCWPRSRPRGCLRIRSCSAASCRSRAASCAAGWKR